MKFFSALLRHPFWLIFGAVLLWDVSQTSPLCYVPDWALFILWAQNIQAHGVAHIYASHPLYNYPPLLAYLLWPFTQVLGPGDAVPDNLYWLKLIPLAFDFAAAVAVVKWANDRQREIFYLLLLIANPFYLFASYTWGQIDSTYCVLVFLTLYAMVQDRPMTAALLYTLAFNFKIQALLFAPLFGLVWWWKLNNPWRPRQIMAAFGCAALLQFAILLPFLLAGEGGRMFDILKNPVNYFHSVSMNAFNFWHFFYGYGALKTNDSVKFLGGWSAQQTGLALFFGFALLVLGPALVKIARAKARRQPLAWSEENLWLMCALIPLGFFFFCTQMHERYSQPALLFVAVYSFRTRHYWLLVFMFLAYGLNMEFVFEGNSFVGYWKVLLDSRLIAMLYALLIGGLLWPYFHTLPGSEKRTDASTSPHRQAGGAEMVLNLGDGKCAEME